VVQARSRSGPRRGGRRGWPSGRPVVPVVEAAEVGDREHRSPVALDIAGLGRVPLERDVAGRVRDPPGNAPAPREDGRVRNGGAWGRLAGGRDRRPRPAVPEFPAGPRWCILAAQWMLIFWTPRTPWTPRTSGGSKTRAGGGRACGFLNRRSSVRIRPGSPATRSDGVKG